MFLVERGVVGFQQESGDVVALYPFGVRAAWARVRGEG